MNNEPSAKIKQIIQEHREQAQELYDQGMPEDVCMSAAIAITDKDENDLTPYYDVHFLGDGRVDIQLKDWVTEEMNLPDPFAIWGPSGE
ncbi:MAG TPA: hypothetical protein H9783_00025 [Candidatus Limosilactobacillus faecipullorum]|nr:hypothetical protein [Candidatus Limosilactobacillus faecipullorum]